MASSGSFYFNVLNKPDKNSQEVQAMLKEEGVMKPCSVDSFLCNGSLKTLTDGHLIFTRLLDLTWHLSLNMTGANKKKKRKSLNIPKAAGI